MHHALRLLPALLTLAGAAFAIWQIGLIAVAARRSVGGLPFAATAAGVTGLRAATDGGRGGAPGGAAAGACAS